MRNISLVVCLMAIAGLAVASIAVSGVAAQTATGSKVSTDDLASHSVGAWGVDLTDRDPSVKPGDDFFMSQNGAWFARTELNSALPMAAYWRDLRRLSPRRLVAILEEVAANKNAPPESAENKVGALYRAFMDEKTIEAKGRTPIEPELNAIRAAKTKALMAALTGRIVGPGTVRAPSVFGPSLGRGVFTVDIAQDQMDPKRYAVYVGQGGLLLPGPEYYLDPQLADIKIAYQAYMAKMLTLIGWPNAEASAKDIVAFETRVADVDWSHERMRAAAKTYNLITVTELSKLAPGFDWPEFLRGAELGKVDKVVIDSKIAFPKIASIFAETPIDVLQARQAFDAADNGAMLLDSAMVSANFDFRVKVFNGQAVVLGPRQNRAESTVEANLTETMAAFYVTQYFSPEAKKKAQEMVVNLKNAFDARLQSLTWISPETKAEARDKLAKMTVKIGYPDMFENYKGLKIKDTDLYGDVVRAAAFNWRRNIRGLSEPFDRSAWTLTPNYPQYNYIPSTNTMEVPAALLQPPFFDLKADDAVNYGAIGSLMGMMIMYGFDPQGGQYDADGHLRDWWAAEDLKRFAAEAEKLSQQYSAIEPLPGVHVKGDLVLSESLADLGGLLIALDAYHVSLKRQPAPLLDGFTGDQRVFLGRAQMWRAKFNANFVRNQLATGVNSPPFLRVNGPVRNVDAWYEAFNVKPGDRLYIAPENRVRIW